MKNLFRLRPAILSAGTLFAAASLAVSCSQSPIEEASAPNTGQIETRVGDVLTLENNGITMQVFDWTGEVFSCQRVTFRILHEGRTMYGEGQVKVEITDMADSKSISHTKDPGYYSYYFFTASHPGCNVKVTLVENPAISANFFIPVMKGGVFLKQVLIDRYPYDSKYDFSVYTIQFYSDKECTQRITAPDMYIHVRLVSVSSYVFSPSAHHYQDVTVYVSAGMEDTCNNRLYTAHEYLPSGETLDDYYEIEFLKFVK